MHSVAEQAQHSRQVGAAVMHSARVRFDNGCGLRALTFIGVRRVRDSMMLARYVRIELPGGGAVTKAEMFNPNSTPARPVLRWQCEDAGRFHSVHERFRWQVAHDFGLKVPSPRIAPPD